MFPRRNVDVKSLPRLLAGSAVESAHRTSLPENADLVTLDALRWDTSDAVLARMVELGKHRPHPDSGVPAWFPDDAYDLYRQADFEVNNPEWFPERGEA
jgi:hypothetical protein